MSKKQLFGIYFWIAFLLPIILSYPYVIFENLKGEGIQGGSSEFLPQWLEIYRQDYPYEEVPNIDVAHVKSIAKLLGHVGNIVIPIFYLSIINAIIAFPLIIKAFIQSKSKIRKIP